MDASRNRAILTAVCVLVATAVAGLPSGDAQQPEHRAGTNVTYESKQYLGKGLTQAKLSSGLTVIVRENHAAPVATVRCYVRNTGSAFEGRYLGAGISHMLEHLVALGTTQRRSEEDIQRLLDSMGGQTNAFTSTGLTAFYVDSPADRADLAIELMAQSMQYSLIPEVEYLREMGVVQRELEMGRADRGRMMYQEMKSLIYTKHPMRHPTIGYLPVVQSVDRQDVIAFYKNRYVPQNLIFIVVGDVDTEHVLEQVLENFKNFQRTTERGVVLPSEPEQASPRSTQLEMEGATTHYSIAWPTVGLQHPDLYPLDVASYLLTTGDSSRLGYRLRIEQPLSISVNSASYTPGFVKGWFSVTVECQPENLDKCQQAIQEEIDRLQSELVSEQELAKVKRQTAAQHVFDQQTVQTQADSIGFSTMSTGDPLFDDRYVEGIQGVTADQVRAVARKYFQPYRTNTVVIDPLGAGRRAEQDVVEVTESDVIRTTLSNGLTVLLKRHSVTPVVSIQAFVSGGVLSDTRDKSGRAALASELMARGTEKYTGRQIAEYFDSVGGSFGMNSQRNTSFLQCAVLRDDFEPALDYAHQVLFKPALAPDEFEKIKQQQLGRIAARQANPQTEIFDFWATQLPSTTPYSRTVLGTTESVSQLSVGDCLDFHRRFFVPKNMVLSIFGDIDPDATLALVERLFGQQSGGTPVASLAGGHEKVSGSNARLTTKRENTAMLIMSYPTVSIADAKTRAALAVLNSILTGGSGAGGRLFNELRGQRLVYYVFGLELTGPVPGFFLLMAQTRPETLDEVISRIKKNLQRIDQEGVPAEEFELAKQKLVAAHAQQNTTPSEQAFQATVDELYGLGYDYDRSYDERIREVTLEDVRNLVRQNFQDPIIASSSP